MSYLLAFAGFSALIILHEFGHFVAAKAVGMRVERFALFFPPLIARWRPRNSETEYGIGAIPLGGYVKITGMNPGEEMPPEVAHRAYFRQPVWKRVVVIAAGPVVNVVLAFLILWVFFIAVGKVVPGLSVVDIKQSSPAAQELRLDDKILAIDGTRGYASGLRSAEIDARTGKLRSRIAAHRCRGALLNGCVAATPAQITVLRDGRRVTLDVRPRYDAKARRMLLGFGFGQRVGVGAREAASLSVRGMWRVTTISVDNIVRLFYDKHARDQVSGVVGSYEATRQQFERSTSKAVSLLALISLSLAIINLFPFLPLDGGHIFWALAEKVRGRAISFRVMERASLVGFVLVLFLFYVGLSNDLGRLSSGEGFGVR